MQLFTLGLNHESAPLAIREKVAFGAEQLKRALGELGRAKPVEEAAILSTCNRTELYCAAGEPKEALAWLAGYHQLGAARPAALPLHAPARGSGAPRVPRGRPGSTRWCSASRRSSGR